MDAESAEKLVNILRSTLHLVEHYGKPVPQSATLCDLERSIRTAISELEAAQPPVINGGRSLGTPE
jgi:hypothetical protein